jgi:hypothetical protein
MKANMGELVVMKEDTSWWNKGDIGVVTGFPGGHYSILIKKIAWAATEDDFEVKRAIQSRN